MNTLQETLRTDRDELIAAITRKTLTDVATVLPFASFGSFLTGLLAALYRPGTRLQAVGHVTPEIEIAGGRADIELIEHIGPSPFAGGLDTLGRDTTLPHDIIYVANPNRVTGASYSVADLQRLAASVPNGALLIDEYYHDYFGITGLPLLESFPNVVILRSFSVSAGNHSADEPGYMLACPQTVARIPVSLPNAEFARADIGRLVNFLSDDEALASHLRDLHQESLRLAEALTRLGVQCRISSTDFILLRVADPTRVGNSLTRAKVAIDNLDGYPAMQHYLRYQVQSPLANDRLLQAFQAMPAESFRMKDLDCRSMTMRLGAQARGGAKRTKEMRVTFSGEIK